MSTSAEAYRSACAEPAGRHEENPVELVPQDDDFQLLLKSVKRKRRAVS
jgi:hypothetical protein